MKHCFCGTDLPYSKCCAPLINGTAQAKSAEQLMRSRYSAYVMAAVDYLINTTHISKRKSLSAPEIRQWAKSNSWQKLEILSADTYTVEFKAHYRDQAAKKQIHHEKSTFVNENDIWYYVDGIFGDQI